MPGTPGTLLPALQDIAELERTIQVAIAPAFLISAVMTALNVMVGRLARLVDRCRALRTQPEGEAREQLDLLARRMHLIYRSIVAFVVAAILVGLLIVVAFVGALATLRIGQVVGLLLIAAMLALIAGLALFLMEVRLAALQGISGQDA